MNIDQFKLLFTNGLKNILGLILIIAGMIGLFLPLVQGIALIIVGLLLLGNKILLRRIRALGERLRHWFE